MTAKNWKAFEPWTHGNLRLRNRIAMAPMTRRMAPANTGVVTPESVEYYRRRAAGEVGLIISEGTAIDSKHAFDTDTVPRMETADHHEGWARVVEAVHAEGGAFAPQLWHTGRMAANPIGPSAAELPPRRDGTPRPRVREMVDEDFAQVLDAFESAARASKDMGCDALEIHGAHGYLLDSFLDPSTNHRDDHYGGSVENRMRFPLEVVRRVRAATGPGYPVIYRFSQWMMDDYEGQKWGNPEELGVWVRALADAGVDILHVSTRRATDVPFPEHGPRTLAGWAAQGSGLPVIAVGSVAVTLSMDQSYGEARDAVSDPAPALELVEAGEIDLLAIGRSLIANPDWVQRVRTGAWETLKPFDKAMLDTLD